MPEDASTDTFDDFCTHLGYSESDEFYNLDEVEEELPDKIREIEDKLDVDAIYGLSNNLTDYTPLAYFKKVAEPDESDLSELFRNVWNDGRASILVVVSPDQIKIYNTTAEPPMREDEALDDNQKRILDIIDLSERALRESSELDIYDRRNLESKVFWKEKRDKFTDKQKVDKHLLENLITLRDELNEVLGLSLIHVNNLIIRSIFVLYLRDRDIIEEEFYENHELDSDSYKEFLDDKEELYSLYSVLKDEFNGGIFEFSEDEKEEVTNEHLAILKKFLEGTDLENGQTRLFPYSFDLIPVELISSIYENFVPSKQGDGVHYTPQSLSNFMLNEISPDRFTAGSEVLDPACGSGVFLVNAYDRLMDKKAEQGNNLDEEDMVEILENNIYGVDKSEQAVKITAFSLYLKLLERLDIQDAREIRLPDIIGDNLIAKDFFSSEGVFGDKNFDIVVGNPPWGNSKPNNEQALDFCQENDYPVSKNQVAQCFMWKILSVTDESSEISVLVPTKSILIDKSAKEFRSQYFGLVNLETIVNLSIIREGIFDRAVHPCSIIRFKPQSTNEGKIKYITPQNQAADVMQSVLVDNTEIKYLPQEDFNRKSAKIAMYGGIRDIDLIDKLSSRISLGEFCEENGLEIDPGEGLQVSGPDQEDNHYPEIAELPHLKTQSVRPYYTDPENFSNMDTEYFHRPRTVELFRGPKTLIKEGIKTSASHKFRSCYTEEDVTFTDSVISINADEEDKDKLKILTAILNSRIAEYYLFMNSSRWGVERAAPAKTEIKDIPIAFPEEDSGDWDRMLELFEEAKNATRNEIEEIRDRIDRKLLELYGLSEEEGFLIFDRINYDIDYFHNGETSRATDVPDSDYMRRYGEIVAEGLNSFLTHTESEISTEFYTDNARSWNGEIEYPIGLMSFKLSQESGEVSEIDSSTELRNNVDRLSNMVYGDDAKSLYFLRKKTIVDENSVNMVKPNEIRFWTSAEALNDRNELLGEIIKHEQLR